MLFNEMINNARLACECEFSVFFLISIRSLIIQCTNRIETNIIRKKAETLASIHDKRSFSRNQSSQFKKKNNFPSFHNSNSNSKITFT